MRNLKLLQCVVEMWESREKRCGEPLPAHMAETVAQAAQDIAHHRDTTCDLIARCEAMIERMGGDGEATKPQGPEGGTKDDPGLAQP